MREGWKKERKKERKIRTHHVPCNTQHTNTHTTQTLIHIYTYTYSHTQKTHKNQQTPRKVNADASKTTNLAQFVKFTHRSRGMLRHIQCNPVLLLFLLMMMMMMMFVVVVVVEMCMCVCVKERERERERDDDNADYQDEHDSLVQKIRDRVTREGESREERRVGKR